MSKDIKQKDKIVSNLDYAIRCFESCSCSPSQNFKNEILSYFFDALKRIKELEVDTEALKRELGEYKVSYYDNLIIKS